MGVYNGEGCAINGVASLSKWEMEITCDTPEAVHSGSLYALLRDGAGGIQDFRGVYRAYGHLPPVFPGDHFLFTGQFSPAVAQSGPSDNNGVSGSAYCERIMIDWAIEPRGDRLEYLNYQVWFSQSSDDTFDTPLDLTGPWNITDSAAPAVFNTEELYLTLDGATVAEVRYMRMVIEAPGKPTVHSDTSKRRIRTRGPLDGQLEYGVFFDDISDLPVVHSGSGPGIHAVRLYVTDTLYWDTAYWRMAKVPFSFDFERPENVQATGILGRFSSHSGTTPGWIKTPEAVPVTKWPF